MTKIIPTITRGRLIRAAGTPDVGAVGTVVIFDTAADHGGVSCPSGWGATEDEARTDVRRTAEQASVPVEALDGQAYLIVADDQESA